MQFWPHPLIKSLCEQAPVLLLPSVISGVHAGVRVLSGDFFLGGGGTWGGAHVEWGLVHMWSGGYYKGIN